MIYLEALRAFLTARRTRAWVYRSLVAAGPLVVMYGLLTDTEAAVWLSALGTWLGVGLAAGNTSTRGTDA